MSWQNCAWAFVENEGEHSVWLGGSTVDESKIPVDLRNVVRAGSVCPPCSGVTRQAIDPGTATGLRAWEGDVPLGTLVEVMMMNQLLAPKALFRLDAWAQKAAVTDYFDLQTGQLNDDRLGRALERLAAHADKVQAALVPTAIRDPRFQARHHAGALRHHQRRGKLNQSSKRWHRHGGSRAQP